MHTVASFFPYPQDAMLTGGEDIEPDIDRIFGKSLDHILQDHAVTAPELLEQCGPYIPMRTVPGYRVAAHPLGVVAVCANTRLCGVYLECDLSVAPAHQGLGIGAELVARQLLQQGTLSVWHHDRPAFSPAGQAAHLAAAKLFTSGRFGWPDVALPTTDHRPFGDVV